jgi:hypothetical protein
MEGVEWNKGKDIHSGDRLSIDLNINNERQVYKIGTVWGVLVGG